MNLNDLKIGSRVIYVDPIGRQHEALVTAIWGKVEDIPCINVVFVSPDEGRQDSFGRQIERTTSLVHRSHQAAHGMYYMMPGDPPNPVAVLQT